MKMESINVKASYVLAIAGILLMLYQQIALHKSWEHERLLDAQIVRLVLEVSELKLAAKGNEFFVPQFGRGQ